MSVAIWWKECGFAVQEHVSLFRGNSLIIIFFAQGQTSCFLLILFYSIR